MSQTVFEKLKLQNEKNLLIQGLPSTIEKQFVKLSFAKNVTPLLRIRKIDFALVFALNKKQLNDILKEVFPALHPEAKLWIAFPKLTSKIVSDLNRCCTWEYLRSEGFESTDEVVLDYVWSALQFNRVEPVKSSKLVSRAKALAPMANTKSKAALAV